MSVFLLLSYNIILKSDNIYNIDNKDGVCTLDKFVLDKFLNVKQY